MTTLRIETENQAIKTRLLGALRKAESLRVALSTYQGLEEKVEWMQKDPLVVDSFGRFAEIGYVLSQDRLESTYVLALTVLLGQFDHLFNRFEHQEDRMKALRQLLDLFVSTEQFYRPIGGLLGYYGQVLRFLATSNEESFKNLLPPPASDMRQKTKDVWRYCYEGVRRLGEMAEIFAVGGAGDRLKLIDPVMGAPLPAARLVFCGRTLLEWLFRDLEALEYWHYIVFGKELSVPVLLMTSHEKNNAEEIQRLGKEHGWFGKSPECIFQVIQPLVPVVTVDGQFACTGPLQLLAKPGGHGVIWKLASDAGAFEWLAKRNVSSAIVRQINNPLGGLDHLVFSLFGLGLEEKKTFGFAAIPAHPGFAEGLNVLVVTKAMEAGISNIEYTKFDALRKSNPHLLEGECPANTNILFADLKALVQALKKLPIPGMVVNAKSEGIVTEGAERVCRPVVRLESMMQSIADAMMVPIETPIREGCLPTFVAVYDRAKAMSVTKRSLLDGGSLFETPESCLYDWFCACRTLLIETCSFELPEEISLTKFLEKGPNCSFFFHQALGPIWEVIGQKISGGRFYSGAEVELEIAELFARDLSVRGSFRLLCQDVVGHTDAEGRRHFSPHVGRAFLKNVSVDNDGVLPASLSAHLNRSVERESSCTIRLIGASELVAENVVIRGYFSLTVRDGTRVTLRQRPDGGVDSIEEPYTAPSWHYSVTWNSGEAPQLTLCRP